MENRVKTAPALAAAALVFCAAALVHLPSLSGSLLWDDAAFLGPGSFASDCRNLPAALSPVNLVKVLPVPMSSRPVVNASLLLDACSGAGPYGLRLTNLLLHACDSALLFLLILTLSGGLLPALGGALLFAVHPAAAEAVNIAVCRSHLLGFFFFTCALLAAVFNARRPAAGKAAAAAACALLGMLSVETAAVLPAAAAAAVYFDTGREGLRRSAPLLAALLLAAGFYVWFRAPRSGYSIEGVSAPGISAPAAAYPAALFPRAAPRSRPAPAMPWSGVYTDREANLFTMGGVLSSYAAAMAFPAGLNSDYNPPVRGFSAEGLALLALPLAAAAAGLLLLLRRDLAGLGITLSVLTLAPVWNLVPIYNLRADRYLYFPLAGGALLAAALLGRARKRPAAAAAAVLTLAWLAGLSWATLRRAPSFRDDEAFFSEAVRRGPGVPRARANLAAVLLRGGDCAGALREAAEASRLAPASAGLKLRLAYAQAWCRRPADAGATAREALALAPRSADALYLEGLLELHRGRRAAGTALLRRALAEDPGHREAALTLLMTGTKKSPGLSPGDKADLAALADLYKAAGLSF